MSAAGDEDLIPLSGLVDPTTEPEEDFEYITPKALGKKTKKEILEYTQRLQEQLDAAKRLAVDPSLAVPSRDPPSGGPSSSDPFVLHRRTRTPSPPRTDHLSARDYRPPNPGTFIGVRDLGKVRNWLAEMEMYVEAYHMNKYLGEAVNTAAMSFTGEAATWWRTVRMEGRNPRTWEAFDQLMMQRWVPPDALDQIQEKFHSLIQKGTVSNYTAEFRRLVLLHPPLSPSQILFQYKQGLKQDIRLHVAMKGPRSLDAAEEAALLAESILRRTSQPTTPNPPRPGNLGATGNRNTPQLGQAGRVNGNGSPRNSATLGNGNRPQKLTPEEKRYLVENNGCFRCRQLGHHTNQCPSYGAANTGATTPQQPRPNPAGRPNPPSRQTLRINNAEVQTTSLESGFQVRH